MLAAGFLRVMQRIRDNDKIGFFGIFVSAAGYMPDVLYRPRSSNHQSQERQRLRELSCRAALSTERTSIRDNLLKGSPVLSTLHTVL